MVVNISLDRGYPIVLYVAIKVRDRSKYRVHKKMTKEVSNKDVSSHHPANVMQDYLLNVTNSELFSHKAGEIAHVVLMCIQVPRSTSARNKMKLNTGQLHMSCYNLFST